MLIQDFLRTRRIQLDITLKEVAEWVGVSEATVSRWETGDIANMRRDRIYKLSQILKVSPVLLMCDDVPESEAAPMTPKQIAEEWVKTAATVEDKAELIGAIFESSSTDDVRRLLNIAIGKAVK